MNRYEIASVPHLVHGRTSKERNPLTLFWTAAGLEINVKASELWVEINSDWSIHEPWYSFMLNGTFMSRRMADKGTHRVCVFRGMNPEVVQNVRIIKDTQAYSADPDSLLQICALETDGEFLPVEERPLKLEFIGDSITSGEGDIGSHTHNWDWCSLIFSAENNYAVMTGQAMNADIRVISQSGWGVGCGWNNDIHAAMPPVYDKVCGLLKGARNEALGAQQPNDFEAWQPDVVFINLGTNDGGSFNSPEWQDEETGECFKNHLNADGSLNVHDVKRFQENVRAFLKKLRSCNPNSKLVWIYGMLGHIMETALMKAVQEYRLESGDENVEYLSLTDDIDHRGARNHPAVQAHKKAAKELVAYLKK